MRGAMTMPTAISAAFHFSTIHSFTEDRRAFNHFMGIFTINNDGRTAGKPPLFLFCLFRCERLTPRLDCVMRLSLLARFLSEQDLRPTLSFGDESCPQDAESLRLKNDQCFPWRNLATSSY